MMRRTIAAAAVFGSLLVGAQAWAQTVEVSEVESPEHSDNLFARLSYGHRYDAEMQGGIKNDLATDDVRTEVGGTVVFNERLRWFNFLGYGYTNYDNELEDSQISSLSLASILGFGLDDPGWTILAGPVLNFSADKGADWGDAVSAGAALGATYKHSPELELGLAVIAASRIEEGATILPVPLVNWRFHPQWRLYTGMTEVAARRGVGGYLEWNFIEPCDVSIGAQFENRRFRLNNVSNFNQNFPNQVGDNGGHNYIGEDQSVPVYLRVNVRIIEGLSADILGGVAFGGKMSLSNSHDHFIDSASYDPQAIIGIRAQYNLDI